MCSYYSPYKKNKWLTTMCVNTSPTGFVPSQDTTPMKDTFFRKEEESYYGPRSGGTVGHETSKCWVDVSHEIFWGILIGI